MHNSPEMAGALNFITNTMQAVIFMYVVMPKHETMTQDTK